MTIPATVIADADTAVPEAAEPVALSPGGDELEAALLEAYPPSDPAHLAHPRP